MRIGVLLSGSLAASAWVAKWAFMIPPGGRVLDLAAGSGRHTKLFAESGYIVEAVDRDISGLVEFAVLPSVHLNEYDLELGAWPYPKDHFSGIVVTNYLHRPLFPELINALAPGGVLVYETFAQGNEAFGRPANPDFLLRPGELLDVVHGQLRVLAFEDIYTSEPKPAMVQRICAMRPVA